MALNVSHIRQEEVAALRDTVALLRTQQADVETLDKAERLVASKHWSPRPP
jgi:hypothetical protein